MKGHCKWFNDAKGFGFVHGEDGKDYFAHYHEIQGTGHKSLAEGQAVEFEPGQSDKGPRALMIRAV